MERQGDRNETATEPNSNGGVRIYLAFVSHGEEDRVILRQNPIQTRKMHLTRLPS